jgi:hypothetical protein
MTSLPTGPTRLGAHSGAQPDDTIRTFGPATPTVAEDAQRGLTQPLAHGAHQQDHRRSGLLILVRGVTDRIPHPKQGGFLREVVDAGEKARNEVLSGLRSQRDVTE